MSYENATPVTAEKPRLPKEVYENNAVGEMAIYLARGEDPGEMFSLLKDVMLVRMSATNVTMESIEGRTMGGDDWLPDPDMPVCFMKPYEPRTMATVRHLEKLGYVKLHSRTARGCAYNVVFPPAKEHRMDWFARFVRDASDFSAALD